ncbi:HAMP domain-containing sensor histidine kinase [Exiguobacterium sp. s138]|uniref:sensor histidine kinase n=2 Tax=Bacillales Family XII. Incertae Sedis TaxID=539742 RepID=UPI001BE9B58D|nr:HAMP domain-containing sensor histidine kinase [Exiguobacterium sp. s138]
MKSISKSLNRKFLGLMLLNFLIFLTVTTITSFLSIKQIEKNHAVLSEYTEQKVEARHLWTQLQQMNINIQASMLDKKIDTQKLNQKLDKINHQLELFSRKNTSQRSQSFIDSARQLSSHYALVLIPLAKLYTEENNDTEGLETILQDRNIPYTVRNIGNDQSTFAIDTRFFLENTNKSVESYFQSIHNQEKQDQKRLETKTRMALWGSFALLVVIFAILNGWTFKLIDRLRTDLVRLIRQTKNPYTLTSVPLLNRQDELGSLGNALQQMMAMLSFQQSQTNQINDRLIASNQELQQILADKNRSQEQLQFQNEFARRLLKYDAPNCIHGLVEDIAHHLQIEEVALTLLMPQHELIAFRSTAERLIPEKIRIDLEKQAEQFQSPQVWMHQQRKIWAIPLLDSKETVPFAVFTYIEPLSMDAQTIFALSNILSLGVLRVQNMRKLNEDKLKTQRILNSLREAIIYVDLSAGQLIHNRALSNLFPELSDLPEDTQELASITKVMERLIVDHQALSLYMDEVRRHLEVGLPIATQDFEIRQNRYVRLYTEILDDQRGLIFVFRERTAEVETIQKEKSFISMISHELRTPLASIEGFSELMIHRKLPPDKQLKYLKTVKTEAQRLGHLVSEFLDYQRMSHQKEKYHFEPFDLSNLVVEIVDWMNISVPSHQIIFDTKHTKCKILADEDKIRRLLINLINNAVKYSPDNPRIDVLLDCSPEEVVVTISDNGLGIPKKDIPHLFDSYYRVDHQEHKKIQGTGLGLLICKEIVDAHGGQISVSSEVNKGSDFLIRLPLKHTQ